MKKHRVITILSLMLFHFVFSQQISFNKKYNLGNCSGGDGEAIIPLKDGYIVCGPVFKDVNCSYGRYGIFKIDTSGNLLWEKDYGNNKCSYGTGPGSLILTSDSGFATCGWIQDSTYVTAFKSYSSNIVFYKFKPNGDTDWVRKYSDTNVFASAENCKQTKDGGYIITGNYSSSSSPNLGLLMLLKIDSLGNVQWQKTFDYSTGIYKLNTGYTVDITADNGFLIGGYCGSTSITNVSSLVIKTDSSGNVKWHSVISTDVAAFATATPDSGGIVVCPYATTSQPIDELYILKYSSTGSVQWQKLYGAAVPTNYPWAVKIVNDSNYIVAGNTTIDSGKTIVGFITKIGSTGNINWYGTYDIYKDTNDQNYLRDIKPTRDKGYVACGFSFPYLSANGNQETWVIKLDSNGCDTVGHCAMITTSVQEISDKKIETIIFPNPSNGIFNFQASSQQLMAGSKIAVYNMLGQEVYVKTDNSNRLTANGEIQIDLNGQPNGIYLYRIITPNGVQVQAGKLMLER